MSSLARFATRAIHTTFSPALVPFRRIRARLRLVFEAAALLVLLGFVAGRGSGPHAGHFDTLALVALSIALVVTVAGYVHEVACARRFLRDVVQGIDDPGLPNDFDPLGFEPYTLRGRSLFHLGAAFRDVVAGRTTRSEKALDAVDRADLGPWELRVYEACRTLAALTHGRSHVVSRLAPLALATGHDAVDRAVATALVRGAWQDGTRLAAIERSLRLGGPDALRLATLASIRVVDLAGAPDQPRFGGLPPEALHLASEDARAVGDVDLAERLLAEAEREGVYRLVPSAPRRISLHRNYLTVRRLPSTYSGLPGTSCKPAWGRRTGGGRQGRFATRTEKKEYEHGNRHCEVVQRR